MAFTQTDLDAVEEAIKSGELTVQYQDRRTTYRSIGELLQVRQLIRQELGLANPSTGGARGARRFRTRTGW